jgi:hypothetical protein
MNYVSMHIFPKVYILLRSFHSDMFCSKIGSKVHCVVKYMLKPNDLKRNCDIAAQQFILPLLTASG